MKFKKAEGCGNDFIIVDSNELNPSVYIDTLAHTICDRHHSVGADGVILVSYNTPFDAKVRFYNSDGTVGEMCGNGIRCAAAYLHDRFGLKTQIIDTDIGPLSCRHEYGEIFSVQLNNITPVWINNNLEINSYSLPCSYIEVGNSGVPHLVVNCKDIPNDESCNPAVLAPLLRSHKALAKGANVTFFTFENNLVNAKTYERGVEDFTLSCGTGAAAVSVALACSNDLAGDKVRIVFPGGTLFCTPFLRENCYSVILSGKARIVFSGDIDVLAIE